MSCHPTHRCRLPGGYGSAQFTSSGPAVPSSSSDPDGAFAIGDGGVGSANPAPSPSISSDAVQSMSAGGALGTQLSGSLDKMMTQLSSLIEALQRWLNEVRMADPEPAVPASSEIQAPSALPTDDVAPLAPLERGASRPPNSIDVRELGAKGDGVTDDQAALQSAFNQAKASGQTVWMPPGTYNHSGVLTADGIHVAGAGEQSVLRATNADQSALRLTGSNGSLSNLTTEVSASQRSSMPDAAGILVQNASNAAVTGCATRGAASNGIRLDNSSHCSIKDNTVMGSNADGIALMNGSCFNLVEGNVVHQAGDDAYSDDSYLGDARQDEGNVFRNDLAYGNHYGRGFALMGSRNATIENCVSFDTPGHGIAAGTDANSGTMTGSGHVIRNNLVLGARDTPFDIDGMQASGNSTSGAPPVLEDWTGKRLVDRSMINAAYRPGTGPGSNNSGGMRT